MPPNRKPFHVLKNEVPGIQLVYDPHKVFNKAVARIVKRPLTDQGEPLAGGTAEHNIDAPLTDFGSGSYVRTAQPCNRPGDYCAGRKVELVGASMDRVNFDSRNDIEPSLLEAEA
jgi:hypothetical protein